MREFNISTNIIRDQGHDIGYIPTKNAGDNFRKIASNFKQNSKFQAIIGSYGTGKSSFLWATEQNLLGNKNYFDSLSNTFPGVLSSSFIKIIGEYKSLSVSLAETLNIDIQEINLENRVINELQRIILSNTRKKTLTVLIIDEFGKFLEFAVKNNPDKEVYFIQQLAEFFNDSKKLAFSISSLHQNFSSYGQSLNTEQYKEWEKVKGRLKEVAFNEPIDQLLFFASRRNKFNYDKFTEHHLELYNLIKEHNVSDKKQTIDSDLALKLLPIDYISAEIMAKALQRYGQNERSLFSFLEIEEEFSFSWFHKRSIEDPVKFNIYNIDLVFEYILEHYYFIISSNLNSDLTNWNSLKEALDQVDTRLESSFVISGRKIVKVIGLLNIFSHAGANINREFIESYSNLALGIKNAGKVIEQLENYKIISYKQYKHRFVFLSWTDLNIDFELQKASQKIQEVKNISKRVSSLNEFHPVLVKSEYFRTGTPRLFEYVSTNEPIVDIPDKSEAIINYVFSEKDVVFESHEKPVIYALFKDTDKLAALFFEIDKAKKVIEENPYDISAKKELEERIFLNIQILKTQLIDDVYSNYIVEWYYAGKRVDITNKLVFNKMLNNILVRNYKLSPILKNELVNKSVISTPISLARKNLTTHLIDYQDVENIGFDSQQFPPEKTIYLSLIKKIGIHRYNNETESFELGAPNFNTEDPIAKSYMHLWNTSMSFIKSSKTGKKNLKELIDILSKYPLRIKRGFIDFWIPIFLIAIKDEYALFNENGYIPNLDTQVFEAMFKSPQKFYVKAFDISGVKLEVFKRYRTIINKKESSSPTEKEFINTIKPFIIFVRSLPEYSLNTKNLTQQSIDLRDAIKDATDPEKAFFEDFPRALNYIDALESDSVGMLEGFVDKMESSIMEIRRSYEELLNRFEEKINKTLAKKDLNYEEYKKLLSTRLTSINPSLLNSNLRNLHRRCIVDIDERKLFLEGIAYSVLGKPLNKIKDHEEQILHRDFEKNYKRLLELVDIHKLKSTHKEDNVFGINIINEKGKENRHQIVIPSYESDHFKEQLNIIKKSFNGVSNDVKRAVLIELLKKEIDD